MSSQQAAQAKPWIVSPAFDITFFIATPLFALAAVLPFAGIYSSTAIYLVVMSFSSVGHHLPGFLRAYGDAALFKHFRWRFILAPPILYGVFLYFGNNNLNGMVLILMLWSIWHVLMQHFGFMRIYDAKVGATSRTDAVWDRSVTLAWFVSIVLWSPQYTHNLLDKFYKSGGMRFSAGAFDSIRMVVWAATALITFGYLIYAGRRILANEPLSKLKLVLLVATISFLGYVWVGLQDIVLGLAIWEIFHDIQYFAITWIYNRRLVEKGHGDTRFMNFLFRKQGFMVALYVIAIAAYGGAGYLATGAAENAAVPLVALIYTSTILHYYFDGFIWKVRDQRTRSGLDLERAGEGAQTLRTNLRSGALQVLGFALPIGTLAAMEMSAGPADELELREAIFSVQPGAIESHLNLGLAYSQVNRSDEATQAYQRALELDENNAEAHGGYALALLDGETEGSADLAAEHLERAMQLSKEDTKFAANLAILRFSQMRTEEALALFRTRVSVSPDWRPRTVTEELLSGLVALQLGQIDIGILRLEAVLKHEPDNEDALEALAFANRSLGRWRETSEYFRRLLEINPERLAIRATYAQSLLRIGEVTEALPILEDLSARSPENLDRKLQLAEIFATSGDSQHRDGARAVELAREVVAATSEGNVGALDIFAAAKAEVGDFAAALSYSEKALKLAAERGMTENAAAITMRRELYSRGEPFHLPAPTEDE